MLDQHQRSMQHQLIDDRATSQLTSPQHHIDKPGRREHHSVIHLMAGQPALRGR